MPDVNNDFEKIYQENYNNLFRFIFSISNNHQLSEEITQATFLKAYENFVSIRDKTKIPL